MCPAAAALPPRTGSQRGPRRRPASRKADNSQVDSQDKWGDNTRGWINNSGNQVAGPFDLEVRGPNEDPAEDSDSSDYV